MGSVLRRNWCWPAPGCWKDGPRALDALLGVADPPTAVMCYNDLAAVGLLAAAAKAGVQVPGAPSVIGYDNIPLSGYTVPALTTVEQPKAAMGREAVALCLRVLCGESAANIVLTGAAHPAGKRRAAAAASAPESWRHRQSLAPGRFGLRKRLR